MKKVTSKYIPPTEAELRDFQRRLPDVPLEPYEIERLIDEIRRLRTKYEGTWMQWCCDCQKEHVPTLGCCVRENKRYVAYQQWLKEHDEVEATYGENVRLRELCGRAEPFVRASAGLIPPLQTGVEWHRFADELRAASEGRG